MREKRTIAYALSIIIAALTILSGDITVFASENVVSDYNGTEVVTDEAVVKTPSDNTTSDNTASENTASENSPSQNSPSENTASENKAGFRVDFYVNGSIIATNYTVSDGSVSAPSVEDITTENYHYEFLFWVLDPNDTTGDSMADLTNIQSDTSVYAFFRATAVGEESGDAPVKKPKKPVTDNSDEDEEEDNGSGTTVITSVTVAPAATTEQTLTDVLALLPVAATTVVSRTPAVEEISEEEIEETAVEEETDGADETETADEVETEQEVVETQIEDEEVPLASPVEESSSAILWWILLLLLAVAVVSVIAYKASKKFKNENIQK